MLKSDSKRLGRCLLTGLALLIAGIPVLATTPKFAQKAGDPRSSINSALHDPGKARRFNYCDWRFKNGGKKSELPDFEQLLNQDTNSLPPLVEVAHMLVSSGTTIALAAKKTKECNTTFEKGRTRYEAALAKESRRIDRRGPQTPSENPDHQKIQTKIIALWRADQVGRRVYIASRTEDKTGAKFWHRRLAAANVRQVDASSSDYIRSLLEEIDWVDSHRFGEDVAAHAWILAQHADAFPELQVKVLERMEAHLDSGGVRKRDYAYLWDRVAVNQGRQQRYGTQPDWECKPGGLTLMPMEDADKVDALRAEMGLGPVEQALQEMTKSVCG